MADRQELPIEVRLRDFVYHAVDRTIADKMTVLREQYYNLAVFLVEFLPDGPQTREKSLALTHLEDSCMRAIQALAVQGTPVPIGQMQDGNTAIPHGGAPRNA